MPSIYPISSYGVGRNKDCLFKQQCLTKHTFNQVFHSEGYFWLSLV